MKGAFALSETFIKILSTGVLAIILLAIFLSINNYHLIYAENAIDREALIVGNTVLSSCIAEGYDEGKPIKALLSEEKIVYKYDSVSESNIDCLEYEKGIYIEIYDEDSLLYGFGDRHVCKSPSNTICEVDRGMMVFPAALKGAAIVIPVTVNVYVGD
ncbi:MAG: hypothetical protein V1818_03785 [Candidatus Aenigmatarchaeota archaeon]